VKYVIKLLSIILLRNYLAESNMSSYLYVFDEFRPLDFNSDEMLYYLDRDYLRT